MTQAPPEKPPERKEDDDPIAHLHKMSTTAGLGSGDYVAVNAVAVVAVLAGLASTLALADNVLLLIPLVGVVLAIIALVQISNSNGTQTGRAIAILGLLLSLLFTGLVGARAIRQNLTTRQDRESIGQLIQQLGDKTKAGKFDEVYGMFDKRFTDRVPREEFDTRMKFVQASPLYGKLQGTTWTGLAQFFTDEESGSETAAAQVQLKFDSSPVPIRENAIFRKIEGKWYLDNLPTVFPTAKPAK